MTHPDKRDLAARMAELARTVASPRSLDDVLSSVTATAKELIPGVDAAGVLLIGKSGTFESLAPVTDLPHQLDQLQMQFN